jgi:transcription antitermination factor NusG
MDCACNEKQWYGLRVRPRFEKIVAQHLEKKGYEGYLPLYRTRREWSDRIAEIEMPLFPGYLFCKFNVSQRLPILVVPGVLSVVGSGRSPIAIPEEEVFALRNVVDSGLMYEPSGFITTGQRVRVERGPLRGLIGIASASRDDCRLIISVNLLQRSISVELDSDSLGGCPVIGSV